MNTQAPTHARFHFARAALVRAAALAALWWILSENIRTEWLVPLLVVATATASSLWLWPPGTWRWRFVPWIQFVPFFLWKSLLGGWDVSLRAIQPSMPVRPGLLHYPLKLRRESARVFFAWVVSLLPGTAMVELAGESATVHALDCEHPPVLDDLRVLEHKVAILFGEGP